MIEINPRSASPSDAGLPIPGTDILLNLIVTFLLPIFLGATDGDISLARLAATETVSAYRAQSHADLLAVAQIIAFGFATLGSLCLSMADDISLTMVLRLRGSANALSRSAETHRRRLEQGRADITPPQPPAHPPAQADASWTQSPGAPLAQPAAKAVAASAPVSPPSPTTTEDAHALWAAALTQAAEQFIAERPHLPPAEQQLTVMHADVLSACTSDRLAEAGANGLNLTNAQASRPHKPRPVPPTINGI